MSTTSLGSREQRAQGTGVCEKNSHPFDVARRQGRPPCPQFQSCLLSEDRRRQRWLFFSQIDPLPHRGHATLKFGGGGAAARRLFSGWLFFSQTPDSRFGEMVLQDDRFRGPGFRDAYVVDGTSCPDPVCFIRTPSVSVVLAAMAPHLTDKEKDFLHECQGRGMTPVERARPDSVGRSVLVGLSRTQSDMDAVGLGRSGAFGPSRSRSGAVGFGQLDWTRPRGKWGEGGMGPGTREPGSPGTRGPGGGCVSPSKELVKN